MDEQVFPVVAPQLWDQLGRPTKVVDLLGVPLLHDRDPATSWATWRKEIGPERLDIRHGPRLTSSDLILRAAEQGQGVALARARLTSESLESGTLIRPFGDSKLDLGVNYWIVVNPDTNGRRVVRSIIEWLLAEAGGQTGKSGVTVTKSIQE
jgi:LysR family glycine cleavage system transcriptional activator